MIFFQYIYQPFILNRGHRGLWFNLFLQFHLFAIISWALGADSLTFTSLLYSSWRPRISRINDHPVPSSRAWNPLSSKLTVTHIQWLINLIPPQGAQECSKKTPFLPPFAFNVTCRRSQRYDLSSSCPACEIQTPRLINGQGDANQVLVLAFLLIFTALTW